MYSEVIFDVETKKLFSEIEGSDPGDLGVSIVSLYQRTIDKDYKETKGELKSFWENEFSDMWPYFQDANRVIGFNTLHFDIPALMPYTNFPFKKLNHFDIMTHVKDALGKRIGLDSIATETLDTKKTDHGLNAVFYWQKGDKESLSKLKKYCEADVILTKDVYDYGVKNKKLKFKDRWNTTREFEVDFSYKQEEEDDQIGLF